MHDDRKATKTGSLSLNQSKMRDLATGIGQTKAAAMMTGGSRSVRVADCIPADQRKAMAGNAGYPKPMALYSETPAMRGAVQTTLRRA
jgi:hypothetical protein